MADQKDGTSSLTVGEVGNAFVGQFYQILHQSPELVHQFYHDISTMSRPGPDGTFISVTGTDGIKDLILSLDSTNDKAEILTADSQASHVNGVMVLVTGCLTGKDNMRRKFTESFFLAPQDNGYFVLNDAFRFVEEASSPVVVVVEEHFAESASAAVAAVTPVQENTKVADKPVEDRPALAVAETTEITYKPVENGNAVAEVKLDTANVSLDEQKSTVTIKAVTEKASPESSVDPVQSVQPVVATSSNGHVDTSKKSYASLLMNGVASARTTPLQVTARAVKPAKPAAAPHSVVSPAAQQTRAATVPARVASESSAPNGSNGSASSAGRGADKGHSVYIGDLPYNATPELIEREFKKFGPIRRGGIQVRSNQGYCFGFVEYEDASAKQDAIDTGTLRIEGKDAFIEEKRTNTRVVNGVSTHPSGRGGFRNRPRDGSYSNGRGYVKSDYAKRNGEDSSRSSSRNGDRAVYQNGGGRGARQGVASK